jgi:hypothetical protein
MTSTDEDSLRTSDDASEMASTDSDGRTASADADSDGSTHSDVMTQRAPGLTRMDALTRMS